MSRFQQIKPRKLLYLLMGVLLGIAIYAPTVSVRAGEENGTATVHGVLFFSPTCGHCHKVMKEDLPPILERYGNQFILVSIDVSNQEGNYLYNKAIERFQVPIERRGVPMLIVGDAVLVGSLEIPTLLPGLIDAGLDAGGISWPDIPGLEVSQPTELIEQRQPGIWETFNQDRTANILSVTVLAGMVISVIWIGYAYFRSTPLAAGSWPRCVIPVLSVIGFSIAAYLSYIEITQTEAICGPVGNCNAVQTSPYARIFGLIPVGILGLVGYLAILGIWLFQNSVGKERKSLAVSLIWFLAFAGTLFSIYLTFLEPFVIGATCIWCITSAIIMTALLWASSGLALSYMRVKTSRRKSYQTISRKKV